MTRLYHTRRAEVSSVTKAINRFFKFALRRDVESVKNKMVFTDRQERIFEMFYVRRQSIDYIADTLCVCRMVINNELKTIRQKLTKIIEAENMNE